MLSGAYQAPGVVHKYYSKALKSYFNGILQQRYTATYIGETDRNLNIRLTTNKRSTRNGGINDHIAEHRLQPYHRIDWDSAKCVTYNTNYYQRSLWKAGLLT